MLLTDLPVEVLNLIAIRISHPKYVGCLLLAEKQLFLKNREIVGAIREASILVKRHTAIQNDCFEALQHCLNSWDGRANPVMLKRCMKLDKMLEEGAASLARFEQVTQDVDGIGLELATVSGTATNPNLQLELRVVIRKLRRCGNWRRRT